MLKPVDSACRSPIGTLLRNKGQQIAVMTSTSLKLLRCSNLCKHRDHRLKAGNDKNE